MKNLEKLGYDYDEIKTKFINYQNYLIIYENNCGDIFKKIYYFSSKKDAIAYFKEKNTQYGYKLLAVRTLKSNNIYLWKRSY